MAFCTSEDGNIAKANDANSMLMLTGSIGVFKRSVSVDSVCVPLSPPLIVSVLRGLTVTMSKNHDRLPRMHLVQTLEQEALGERMSVDS